MNQHRSIFLIQHVPPGEHQDGMGYGRAEGARYGIKPEWRSYGSTALTPACQEAFGRIGLRWHDLRHEYASRLVEQGTPLAQVGDLLGHASITTTARFGQPDAREPATQPGCGVRSNLSRVSVKNRPNPEDTAALHDQPDPGSKLLEDDGLGIGWEAGI